MYNKVTEECLYMLPFAELYSYVLNFFKIDAEFKLLYDEKKGDSLCLEFGSASNLIILQGKNCGRKSAEDFANSFSLDLSSAEPSTESKNIVLINKKLILLNYFWLHIITDKLATAY